MKNNPYIYQEGNCVYLVLDLGIGTTLYDRAKLINKFVRNDTQVLEKYLDTLFEAIFRKNGINIQSHDKLSLEKAFEYLNWKNKDIKVQDLYDKELYRCHFVGVAPNKLNVQIEDNRYLQAGVEIKEVENAIK